MYIPSWLHIHKHGRSQGLLSRRPYVRAADRTRIVPAPAEPDNTPATLGHPRRRSPALAAWPLCCCFSRRFPKIPAIFYTGSTPTRVAFISAHLYTIDNTLGPSRRFSWPLRIHPLIYYRQRVLLALLEQFGRSLGRTDCQKLLFLFCKKTERNYYDFFPYQYGGFSFLSYRDKSTLAKMGLLEDTDEFQLGTARSFSRELTRPRDREQLSDFASEFAGRRGRPLIKEAYLSYPQYACRSTILDSVLTGQEIAQLGLRALACPIPDGQSAPPQ